MFLKVGDIDTLNEKFYAEAFIEAKWIDLSLSATEKYSNEFHWNPNLYILNSENDFYISVFFWLRNEILYFRFSDSLFCLHIFDKLRKIGPLKKLNRIILKKLK